MNNSTQAQKGFKTFLLTLSISLIVFSAIYYVITNTSSSEDSLPAEVSSEAEQPKPVSDKSDSDNAFSQLAMQPMDVPSRAVLAGASTAPSQTTQSTTSVPTTGLVGVTFGLFASLTMFLSALYVIARDPRRLAMLSFEKETIRRL